MISTKMLKLKARTFYPFNQVVQFILANLALSFVLLLVFVNNPFGSVQTFLIGMTWSFAICSTQWLGHGLIFDYLDKKISWIEKPVKRSLWGLAALVVYSVLAFYVIQSLMNYLVNGRTPTISWDWLLGNVFYPVAISFVITLTLTAIGFFNAWKTAAVRAEKLNTEMMAYKYEVLRNQINPHFLFNSFNVLSDLVYEDQDSAVRFIQKLSQLFRYVLESREKELVLLKEELEFVDSFSFLLQARFEDKLQIHRDFEPGPDEMIVPVSIQMLIENAVKHNEVSAAHPLQINISRSNDFVVIANTLKEKNADSESTKVGLNNLKQQFSYFTNREIKIEKSVSHFAVYLPVIHEQMQGESS
jgi:hypothetical protein